MNVRIIRKEDFATVENFLLDNFSSPTHWPEWNLLVSSQFQTEFYYFGLFSDNILIGICPFHFYGCKNMLSMEVSGHFHYIPYGGWIFSRETEVKPDWLPGGLLNKTELFSLPAMPEFNSNYRLIKTKSHQTFFVNLQKTLVEIWENDLSSKRRNMIRKAWKNNVTVESISISDLKEFYTVYHSSSERNSLPVLPLAIFEGLLQNSQNIKLSIYKAVIDNQSLGYISVLCDSDYSIYWLGNSVDNVDNFGQGELLQWHAITKMKEAQCKIYDLCVVDQDKLPDIARFKRGFSKHQVPIHSYSRRPLLYRFINRISKYRP